MKLYNVLTCLSRVYVRATIRDNGRNKSNVNFKLPPIRDGGAGARTYPWRHYSIPPNPSTGTRMAHKYEDDADDAMRCGRE